jgi:hypothetical protein
MGMHIGFAMNIHRGAIWRKAAGAGLLALLVMGTSARAADPEASAALWRGARYGMSEGQVRALFPSSRPPAKDDRLLDGSARELLESDDVFANMPAKVAFFFSPAGLKIVVVTVTGTTVSAKSIDAVVATFNSRYGKPIVCDWLASQGKMGGCVWPASPVTVAMFGSVLSPELAARNNLIVNYYSAADYQREFGQATKH